MILTIELDLDNVKMNQHT